MDIAERIKLVRGELSQAEFAQLLGVHKNSLGRYERGDSKPDIEFAGKICTSFGVCPEWLLMGTGNMHGDAQPLASVAAGETADYNELRAHNRTLERYIKDLSARNDHLEKRNGHLEKKQDEIHARIMELLDRLLALKALPPGAD